MVHEDEKSELDLGEVTTLPELREIALPKLSPFRRLQAWAVVVALVWTIVTLIAADHLIMRETEHEVEAARSSGLVEAGYVARLLEQELTQAERLATTLALQDNIVRAVRAVNKSNADFDQLEKATRYQRLVAHPDLQMVDDYLARLAAGLDLNQIYLLDKSGLCIASSQWERPDVCVGANYAQRRYFQEAMENGSARQFAVGRQVRIPSFFFSSAIRDGNSFLGTVVVRTTSDDITNVLLNGNWLSMVVDGLGMVVGSTDKSLLLKHIGRPLAPVPDAEHLKSVYAADQLEALDLTRAANTPYGLDLWSYAGHPQILIRTVVRGGDLTVFRMRPARQFLDVRETGWSLATAVIVVGLLIIVLIERTGDYAARRQAHLSALSGANATLSWVARRLYDLAVSDSLTSVSNRRFFIQRLEQEAGRAARGGRPLSLAMIDIDHFKRVNDAHGHPIGDQVIRSVAKACMELVRAYDVVGRLGGEEFAILLPDADAKTAIAVAERIRRRFDGHGQSFDGQEVSLTCSIGVATLQPDWTAGHLLSAADKALYTAKDRGRNRVVKFDEVENDADISGSSI